MHFYTPQWVYPRAKYDLDFRNNRYWGGYVDRRFGGTLDRGSLISANGAYTTDAYSPTKSGTLLRSIGTGGNRITDLGLFAERGAVNNALWCRDLTNGAWVLATATTAKDQTGADGTANSASSITATGATDTVLQSITLVNRVVIFSAYIKRITGTGTVSITSDGTTWTDVTSQINSMGYTWVQNAQQTISSVVCGFQLGTNGDKIAVDFCQLETSYVPQFADLPTGSKATTPLLTTSATVTRTNEAPYSGNLTNMNSGLVIMNNIFNTCGPWTALFTWNGDVTSNTPNGPVSVATDMTFPASLNGGIGVGFGTTNRTANTGTNGRGNWNKTIYRCRGDGGVACLNGGALSTNLSTGKPNVNAGSTHFNIGNNGSGTGDSPLNGTLGRASFWPLDLQDGQVFDYAGLTNQYDPYV